MLCTVWLILTLQAPQTKKHQDRLQAMLKALERKPKGYGAHPNGLVYGSALSWNIRCKEGVWYASASWEVENPVVQTNLKQGVLGIDINATSIEWAVCKSDGSPGGNKKSKRIKVQSHANKDALWAGSVAMDLRGLSQEQSTHRIRHVVLELVDLAGRRGVPIGIEVLDFSKKKASLRYESGARARALSSFAYGKFKQELMRCAAKRGVEVMLVDPAWTYCVKHVVLPLRKTTMRSTTVRFAGGVKYASKLGMSVDKAAAG